MTKATEDSKLISFYRTMLPAIGYYADADGMISHHYPGCHDDMSPVMVGTKRLVLPTLLHRKDPDFSRRMMFNPMLQNVTGSESLIMDKIRDRATTYAGFTIAYLFASLAKLAVRKESHKDLNPDEASYLAPLADADEGFAKRLQDIISSDDSVHRNNREFVKFTIHKGRSWNGEKRQRVAGAHFRLYEQMLEPDFNRVLAGVSMRQKDVKMLKDLYEHVFPEIAGVGSIEFGTDMALAPSMISLLTVYKAVIDRTNFMAASLAGCIPGADLMIIPTEWWADIVNVVDMAAEINALPMFEGNNSKNKVMTEQEKTRIAQASVLANEQLAVAKPPEPAAPVMLGTPSVITAPQGQQYVPAAPMARPGAMLGSAPSSAPIPPVATLGSVPATSTGATALPTMSGTSGINVISMPSASLAIQQKAIADQRAAAEAAQRLAYEQATNPMASSQQLPEGARMVNNVLYVPAPANASGVVPVGALTMDGRLYVPYQQAAQPMVNAFGQQVMQPGMVPGMPQGANFQQMLATDAATWPNVSPQLAVMLNNNLAMKSQYLSQMMQSHQNAAMYNQQQQQQKVPRYLQQILEEDRQAEINQRHAQFGGAFGGMRLGGTVPGMVPGMPVVPGYQYPNGMPNGYVQVNGGYQPTNYPGSGMAPPGM